MALYPFQWSERKENMMFQKHYPNRETYLVALWIDNNRYIYETIASKAIELENYELADYIRETIVEDNPYCGDPEIENSVYGDLLGTALNRVDWRLIAQDFTKDFEDN